jgi:hypothetical protein
MKKILVWAGCMLFTLTTAAQQWNASAGCHINANHPFNIGRDDLKRAAIKIRFTGAGGGLCTGTLVNRNTDLAGLGQFMMTANHCINGVDFNRIHNLYFNYQSSNANNNGTFLSNQGQGDFQSTNLTDNGYQYRHTSRLRVVADHSFGDFALLEILDPIPPHFNVFFAGWNPSIVTLGSGHPPLIPTLFVGIHHPRGDIKKMSGVNNVGGLRTPVVTRTCRTITKVIDFLFGWIWRRRWSTEVICSYTELPWINIPAWNYGTTQPGSSGSGFFLPTNQLIGVLSGGLAGCDLPVLDFYGKFRSSYYRQTVKNNLNPSNNYWVDQFGIGGRQVNCRPNLVLNGTFFPANHYQANNNIVLRAANNVTVNGNLRILTGANYEFRAGNSITLGTGFTVDPGAVFTTSIAPCNVGRFANGEEDGENSAVAAIKQDFYQRASKVHIPHNKPFVLEDHLKTVPNSKLAFTKTGSIETIAGNNGNSISVKYNFTAEPGQLNVSLMDMHGRILHNEYWNDNLRHGIRQLHIQTVPNGIYLLRVSGKNGTITEKVYINR